MHDAQTRNDNIFLRGDTILGVCQGLGEDFGFNPLWLRIAFAAGMFVSPYGVVALYLGLGLVVLVSRLAFRDVRKPKLTVAAETAAEPQPAAVAEPERIAA